MISTQIPYPHSSDRTQHFEQVRISFMDSTCLKVTRNRRISQHKVFKDIAARWKTERRLVLWFKVTSSHQRSRRVT
ncbi:MULTISPECIES: transposase [unclassified Tychonema]|uniref:transposase n=1 Tax=unclassified Tychonema TaxID=2642144 RepID=UPI0034CF4164